jgi:LmbE family N-acetylglucosaminyl deacetylase
LILIKTCSTTVLNDKRNKKFDFCPLKLEKAAMKDSIVIFAPHPDDETFACGGIIAKRLTEGYEVKVVFLTDGRNALRDLGVFSQPTPLELKEIRRDEATRATKILGLSQDDLIFLDIEDGEIGKNEQVVSKQITEILNEKSPKEIYFPQEKEYNIDHRSTNHLVRKAIKQLKYNPIKRQYLIAWSYPFNILARIQPQCLRKLILYKLQNFELVDVDISDFESTKKAAIKEYNSQLKIFAPNQPRTVIGNSLLQQFLGSKESFLVSQ